MLAVQSFHGDGDIDSGYLQDAVLRWICLCLAYHSLVTIYCWGGFKELFSCGPFWFQISRCTQKFRSEGSKGDCCLRIARYYKCQKRCRKREERGADTDTLARQYTCPFYAAKQAARLHFPAPLPFRRRNKSAQQERDETIIQDEETKEQKEEKEPIPGLRSSLSSVDSVEIPVVHDTDDTEDSGAPQPKKKTKKSKSKKSKRRSTKMTRSRTSLLDLARMQQWNSLVDILGSQDCGKEARHKDVDGLLPLHWACSGGPPVDVVKALLQAYPKAAEAVDSDGSSPLHFACHYGGSAAVAKALLEAHPQQVSIPDKYGRTPLFHAIDKSANCDVVKVLVDADPSLITKPCLPTDPERAQRILARDRRPLEHRTPLFLAWTHALSDRTTRQKRSGRLWCKAQVLLEGAYRVHFGAYLMLHASIAFDKYLPSMILDVALDLHPGQLLERQEGTGRSALAVAAAASYINDDRAKQVLEKLVDASPSSAISALDGRGRLPLALGIESGKSWEGGLEILFHAAPELIHRRDRKTGLPPALVSATYAAQSQRQTTERSDLQARTAFPLQANTKAADYLLRRAPPSLPSNIDTKSADPDVIHTDTVYRLVSAAPSVVLSS